MLSGVSKLFAGLLLFITKTIYVVYALLLCLII